jgi:ATP-dependent exoDNAse (exonuclease V) beta subunit
MSKELERFVPGAESAATDVDGCHLFDPELPTAPAASPNGRVGTPAADQIEAALAERSRWIEERDATRTKGGEELVAVPATSREEERAKSEREPERVWARSSEAAAVGTALHRIMEVVDLEHGTGLEQLVAAACSEAGVLHRAEEVLEMARNCLASAVVRRAVELGSYTREVQYRFSRDNGIHGIGRVDLLFTDGPCTTVVDYKSDRPNAAKLNRQLETYEAQARAYAVAISSTTQVEVGAVILVFAHSGDERSVTF